MKTSPVREIEVEKYLCDQIKTLGGIAYKFVSPGNRGVPDRLCVLPNGITVFVEVKSPTGKLHPTQLKQIKKLFELKHLVFLVSHVDNVDALIERVSKLLPA